jgi:regulator of sigma E protease
MEFWIKAAQLILSLSILIVLHELGHFLPARWFGTRVEKFYLFFDAGFSLFKFKKGDTEYGIGWIPLGGYVKISGMIDESMDKEQLEKPAEPWEFRSKPTWQRLIIMIGGVTVNFILALLIYIAVMWVWGKEYLPVENAIYGVHLADESIEGEDMFMEGDMTLDVNGNVPQTLGDISSLIVIDGHREIHLIRDGADKYISLPSDFEQIVLANVRGSMFQALVPTCINDVTSNSGAAEAGLQENDSLVEINGKSFPFFQHFTVELQNHKASTIELGLYRAGEHMVVQAHVSEEGTLGFHTKMPSDLLVYKTEKFGFFESIPEGINLGVETLGKYVKSMGLLFSKEGAKQLGGFGSIGKIFPSEWNWQIFWLNTAFLSIILAFMNILPIPALDGGHVMFLVYEMVAGKAPSDKFLTRAQVVGMVLLLSLLLYANGMDLYRWIVGA